MKTIFTLMLLSLLSCNSSILSKKDQPTGNCWTECMRCKATGYTSEHNIKVENEQLVFKKEGGDFTEKHYEEAYTYPKSNTQKSKCSSCNGIGWINIHDHDRLLETYFLHADFLYISKTTPVNIAEFTDIKQNREKCFGKYIFSNGDVYLGELENNKPKGKGVMFYQDVSKNYGIKYYGTWNGMTKIGTGDLMLKGGVIIHEQR